MFLDLREALLALPAGDDPEQDYVFRNRGGGPLDPDNLDRRFKRDLKLAGIPEIRFQDPRHTQASLLIAAGPSQGHSRPAWARVDQGDDGHLRAPHAERVRGRRRALRRDPRIGARRRED